MDAKNHQAEFERLVDRLLDQTISQDQGERLEQLMLDDPEYRSFYFDQVDVHLGLPKVLSGIKVGNDSTEADARFRQLPLLASVPPSKPSNDTNRYLVGLLALATAASLLLGVGMLKQWLDATANQRAANQQAISEAEDVDASSETGSSLIPGPSLNDEESGIENVVLAQNSMAEFFGELSPPVGSSLQMRRQYILTHGNVELIFPSGASALLDAPAIFSVVSADRLLLESGQCSVHAPDGAEGFQVETPLANVVDLGTRFGVKVDEGGQTSVKVIEGEAEVFAKQVEPNMAKEAPKLLRANDSGFYSGSSEMPDRPEPSGEPAYRYSLPDRILGYEATPASDPDAAGVSELTEVSVQRGGKPFHYSITEMIPSEVTYFRSTQEVFCQPVAYRYGDDRPIAEILKSDNALDTGILNPGGSKIPLTTSPDESTPGMAIRFAQPVVNSIGPDIAFFEIQNYITNPTSGDPFHVSPLEFKEGLKSFTVAEMDIQMTSPESKVVAGFGLLRYENVVTRFEELLTMKRSKQYRHNNFRALAVGIDLSDLGYSNGETVTGLFFQDAADDEPQFDGSVVDPVYIGGFPAL
ncbi:FecR family protein [Neorhodopirellula lusitana]|uniref:FecR family protein n=1 Tax=Neorhodopirellula lusitana TaxID=445327 RepID=A0ABY1QQQ2_9BACT|nr:FecR domain-containing protein [Neorhodopirellula lusitana]SMP76026.1 FecR family protein [Neorhodopirellula lusitana]